MSRKIWSIDEMNFIKNNLSKMTIAEMAEHFNVPYAKMADKIHKMGLNRKKASGELWSEEEDTLIKQHFEYAPKNYLINLLNNRTWNAIYLRGSKTFEIERKSTDRYSVDYNFFEKWNSESAYVFGFIAADGYVFYERGSTKAATGLQFEIADYDIDILEKIKKVMNFEGPISKSNRNTVKLQINNKKIVSDLIDKGMPSTNKTFDLDFPKTLPKEFYKDFVRGLFDGDGSIYLEKERVSFQILGTNKVLTSIKSILPVDTDNNSIYDRSKNGCNVCCLKISNKKSKEIYDWLYKDATIYLDRKFYKYNELLKITM